MLKEWRKILYEKQPYPDNYTAKNIFLKDLKRNPHPKPVTFLEAFLSANVLLQEFCTVVLFVIVYLYLVNKWVHPSHVLYTMGVVSLLGFIFYRLYYSPKPPLGHDIRTILTFIAFGQLFSPVLHTLTDTISTDTIYTMTFLMMLVHLIFFDYGVGAAVASKSLALSAAMFASICLASRLASPSEAFVLLTVATQFFVLSPILRKALRHHLQITFALFLVDAFLLLRVSRIGLILFVSSGCLIDLVCPFLFVKNEKFKDNIYGPWDEAVVKEVTKKKEPSSSHKS